MAGVTIPYGFELPLGVENISVPLLNRNFNKINDALQETKDVADKAAKGTVKHQVNAARSTGLAGTGILNEYHIYDLVSGRSYQMIYTVDVDTTVANMALIFDLRKSAVDKLDETGTSVAPGITNYSSPVAGGGATLQATWNWKATANERVALKAVTARLTTTAGYNIAQRRLYLIDMGANS